MDNVVKEIDILAQEKSTNRSKLINQILAEYVSLVTPEKQINEIFTCLDNLLCSTIFSAVEEVGESIMSVKTSLNYKYRPTVKYSVELIKCPTDTLGYLKVAFRTQSHALLDSLEYLFTNFASFESAYLKSEYNHNVSYLLDGGKFVRSLATPKGLDVTIEQLAQGISDYISMLDEIIKNYLEERYNSFSQIEKRFLQYITDTNTVII
jgi:hypothetical protein